MRGILDGVRAHEVSPAFVGRQAELSVLADVLRRATARTPGAVLIGGEAGGGKTRLVGEFAERVGGEALILSGACLSSARRLPVRPVHRRAPPARTGDGCGGDRRADAARRRP